MLPWKGDDLAIVLFAWSIAFGFGLEAMNASGATRRWSFGGSALAFLLLGLFWATINQKVPTAAGWFRDIATTPTNWFTLFMFGAAVFAFGDRRIPRRREAAVAAPSVQSMPEVEQWMTPLEAMAAFCDQTLTQDIQDRDATQQQLSAEAARAAQGYRETGHTAELEAFADERSEEWQKRAEAQNRYHDAQFDLQLARDRLFDDLIRRLRSGELVARGVEYDGKQLREDWEYLRPAYWVSLTFVSHDLTLETVSGGGRTFKGLQIGKPRKAGSGIVI